LHFFSLHSAAESGARRSTRNFSSSDRSSWSKRRQLIESSHRYLLTATPHFTFLSASPAPSLPSAV
jgi:hypothetical protein